MIQSLYTAASGISCLQTKIDVIADNIANINTPGYKSSRAGFRDALYLAIENPEDTGANMQRGTGVSLASTDRSYVQGAAIPTGNDLDLAINGGGFFALMNADGETVYTRSGAFSVSAEDGGSYLTSAGGAYVLDSGGMKIKIQDAEDIKIGGDGSVEAGGSTAAVIGVFAFPNAEGLASVGNGEFAATEASGQAFRAPDYSISQGQLEGSNVDLAEELTQLIQAQRLYSFAGRALDTADKMEGLAISMR